MRLINWLMRRIRGAWRSDAIDAEIGDEMAFHVEMRTEENIRAGMEPAAARRDAERRFGSLVELRERGYDVRGGRWIEDLWRDVRFALRMFAKNPAFTMAAVASLALGIGASAAIFSVVDGVLLRPLPYPEPDRIVALREVSERGTTMPVCEPNFEDVRARVDSFEAVAAYGDGVTAVSGGIEPVRANVANVSADFFRTMGVAPLVGRTFVREESTHGSSPTAVVSYGFWQRLLGGRADLSSTVLRIEDHAVPVVGVMPRGFAFPNDSEVWVTAESQGPANTSRSAHNWSVVGRLASAASLDASRAEVRALARTLRAQNGESMDAVDFSVLPLQEYLVGDVRTALFTLLGAVGLLLLIACANVANLLLARATARRREFAMREALGAGRWRIARQSLTECVLLAIIASFVGIVFSYVMLGALLEMSGGYLPHVNDVGVDARSLIFGCGLAVVVGVALGLVPIAQSAMRTAKFVSTRGQSSDRKTSRIGSSLVVGQIALTLVLAVGASLLARSFVALVHVDPGFHPESAVAMTLSPPPSTEGADRQAESTVFENALLDKLSTIPGVTAVGCTSSLPMSRYGGNGTFAIDNDLSKTGDAEYRTVTAGYFDAMGIPILAGRVFTPADVASSTHVAVISRSLADKFWPNGDAIGHGIQFGNMDGDTHLLNIVGIVGDIRERGLDRDVRPIVYADEVQRPRPWMLAFVARTDGRPATLTSAMGTALHEIDPSMPATFRTLDALVASSLENRRFSMTLFGVFAIVALVLAATGIYGLTSYSVAQRTQEIGIRMALGAARSNVLRLVLGRGLALAAIGVGIGVATAIPLARLLESALYGISATDPLTLALVSVAIAAAALAACLAPARRATKVDPIVTLKYE